MLSMESNMEAQLNIDLLNFDETQFADSKYILTSPRSLEACSRLNIKPIEILSRPLEDFRDELLPRGVSVRSILEIYNEGERERQNKLQLCIEERRHIITEEGSDQSDYLQRSESAASERHESASTGQYGVVTDPKRIWTTCTPNKQKPTDSVSNKKNVSQAKRPLYQRFRKQKKTDFNSRLEKIKCGVMEKLQNLNEGLNKSTNLGQKRQPRSRMRSHSDLGYSSEHDEYSDASSLALSSRSCLTDVSLITDPLLKKKLHGLIDPDTRLRAKDQKILSVMLQQKEKKRTEEKQRGWYHIQWEEDRRRVLQEHDIKENQRLQSVAKQRSRMNQLQMESQTKRMQQEEEHLRERERELENTYRISSASRNRQQMMKLLKLQERQIQEMEKKRSVDLKLEQQKKEMEDHQNLMKLKQETELKRASSFKLMKEQEQAMRTRIKNKQVQERHQEKLTEIRQHTKDDLALLCKSLEFRDRVVQDQLSRHRRQRDFSVHEKQMDLDSKIQQSRKNQMELEEEIKTWHKQLTDYHNLQERRAALTARQTSLKKSQKAKRERSAREKMQQENMKQILEEDDQWRKNMEATIAMKQRRIDDLQNERDKMIQESRNLAGVSERLRSHLKQHYSLNDLSDLNKKTQLENKMLFRPPNSRTNNYNKSDNITRLLLG